MITKTLLRRPLFKAGLACQAFSFLLVVSLVVSIKAGWVSLPTSTPEKPAPGFTPMDAIFLLALLSFAIGFTMQLVSALKAAKSP